MIWTEKVIAYIPDFDTSYVKKQMKMILFFSCGAKCFGNLPLVVGT